MRILHTVESYTPSTGGMQEMVQQISERLVILGHDVTVVTSKHQLRSNTVINGVKIKDFSISGNLIKGIVGEQNNYRDYLIGSDFDIITNFAAQQWATDIMMQNLKCINGKKVLVPQGFSGLYLPEYNEYFEKMKEWMKYYDMNVFPSNCYRDIEFARKCGIKKIIVIPNGASEKEFLLDTVPDIRNSLRIPSDHFLVITVGSHNGEKGHRETIEIFKKTKISHATLVIAGREENNRCYYRCKAEEILSHINVGLVLKDKKILIRSLTRPELVALYKAADLFLFLSNIECSPLVLIESMASMTPFLSTDVGNSVEIVEQSNGGKILPTHRDDLGYSHADIYKSIKMVEDLYNNPDERKYLAKSGFEKWKRELSWEKIGERYEELYLSLISETNI